jgi:hypothetical protein
VSEHDSQEDSAISALYRRASNEEPASHLDGRIMAVARRHATRRTHRWWLPLSTAAVLVLAVTLLLRHQQAPDELQEQFAQLEPAPAASAPPPVAVPAAPAAPATPRKEERIAAKPESRAKSSVAEAPLAEAPLADSAKSVASPAEVAAAPSPALAAAPSADMAGESRQAEAAGAMARSGSAAEQKREAVTEAAEPWLKRIEALRVKGEIEAARRELAAFRKVYPGYVLPRELQALLPEAK